jgi:hypothetical protein
VDPLPPFAADTMTLDGHDVVVVRVDDSNQTPHLLKATGTIEIREPGGRKPIAAQSRLLELCLRPEQAPSPSRAADDEAAAGHRRRFSADTPTCQCRRTPPKTSPNR